MGALIAWVAEHYDDLGAAAAALYALVSIIVGLTPTAADDQWLAGVVQQLSFLAPDDARGTLKLPGKKPEAR